VQLSQIPLSEFTALSAPIAISQIDFSGSVIPRNESSNHEFLALADGKEDAIFFWWDLKMNESGSILLSCAPHWEHPDTDSSLPETTRRNAIPWRDHWMQAIFNLDAVSNLDLKKGDKAFIHSKHDEFSWSFEVSRTSKAVNAHNQCSCSFHMLSSRNRIMQMNSFLKSKSFNELFAQLPKASSVLVLGDHSMLALLLAKLRKNVYTLENETRCGTSIKNFIDSNALQDNIKVLAKIEEAPPGITHVICEPHFNTSILPWDNIAAFARLLQAYKKVHPLPVVIAPSKVTIYALPVSFLHLHKIRWPLASSCEGFDHKIFDEFIAIASSIADANVEAFNLWEYPCIALGSPTQAANFDMIDFNVSTSNNNNSSSSVRITNYYDKQCNGIALWVDYHLTADLKISGGPCEDVKLGELIKWRFNERQAVHLIPYHNIVAGKLTSVDVSVEMAAAEAVTMKFSYNYDPR